MWQILAVLIIITFSKNSEGIICLSCGDPFLNQPLVCNCTNTENSSIEWLNGSNTLSICSFDGSCIGGVTGATFTTDFSAGYKYIFTIQSYDYNSCGTYTCKDATYLSTESYAAEVNVFDNSVPSAITEPAKDHTDGNIEITTSCLYKNSDINVLEWKYNHSGKISDYKPDSPFRISTKCPSTCNGNATETLRIGFPHTEYQGHHSIEVKFQLKVCHDKFPNACLERVTQHSYFIQETCSCIAWEISCGIGVALMIVCIVFSIVLIIVGRQGKPVIWRLSRCDIAVYALVFMVFLYTLIVGAIGVNKNDECRRCTNSDIDECYRCLGLCGTSIALSCVAVIVLIFFIVIRQGTRKQQK